MAHSSPSEQVAALAEAFVERFRRGERPSIREYTDRFPDLAADIREVFPAVAMMENIALDRASLDGFGPAPPAAPPPVSQVGDFRIVREVGRGGMGVVYEAEQVSLGRFVALKLLPQQAAATPRQKERFLREARAAAKLHHTNIVPVFGFGEADGVPYYAMQFICGQGVDAVIDELRAQAGGRAGGAAPAADLARSLVSGEFRPAPEPTPANPPGTPAARPLSTSSLSGETAARPGRTALWKGVARLGVQVANALDHAHQLGVLHRDVKPSNLLLDIHGTAWVTDFGLAKTEGQPDLTRHGDVLGTLRYLPPEALDGKADARGDVFALGLTLYELLALRPAFDAPDRARLVLQVTAANPPPLRKLVPGVPRDLATIVHKAIQKDPARRYQSAAAVADDLQRFLDNRPIAARPVSAVGHAWRACKRNPVASGMAAAAVLALVSGTGAAVWGQHAADAQRVRAERNERDAVDAAGHLRAERDAAADRLYVSDMNRAQLNWYGGSVTQVRDLLAAHRPLPGGPDRRGIEWYYLNRLANTSSRVVPADLGRFPVLLVGPGGKHIFSAAGGVVEAREVASGDLRWAYRPARAMKYYYSAALSPAGDRLVYTENTGPGSAVLRVLDAATGRVVKSVPVGTEVRAVAYSPTGEVVAGGGADGLIRVWDVTDGGAWAEREPLRPGPGVVEAVAFSPDGSALASLSQREGDTLRVWDTRSTPWRMTGARGADAHFDRLILAPGGKRAVTCGLRMVRCWDLTAIPTRLAWERECGGVRVALHPDGVRLVVACTDSMIRVLDAATGADLGVLRGHENAVDGVVVHTGGAWVASTGRDRTLRFWDLAGATAARPLGGRHARVMSAAYSPDGAVLVTAGAGDDAGEVWAWDVRTARPVRLVGAHRWGDRRRPFGPDAQRVRFSPDGRWLASAGRDGVVKCWGAAALRAGGEVPPAWEAGAHTGWLGAVDVDFHPDGRYLLSAGWDYTVKVFEVATGRPVRTIRTPGFANWNVCYRPGGRQIAVACDVHGIDTHPSVLVYDADTGREVIRLSDPQVAHGVPRYSPDGTVLYTSWDGVNVRTWDADTGRPLPTVFKGHTAWVQSIAASPDGRRLLTASDDGTARVWDTATGHELLALRGHAGIVREAAFGPTGDAILTAGDDGTARVWDAPRE